MRKRKPLPPLLTFEVQGVPVQVQAGLRPERAPPIRRRFIRRKPPGLEQAERAQAVRATARHLEES